MKRDPLQSTQDLLAAWKQTDGKEERKMESSFRHGYLQGFVDAFNLFLRLVTEGYSHEEVTVLMTHFENLQLIPWVTGKTEVFAPPLYNHQDLQRVLQSTQDEKD